MSEPQWPDEAEIRDLAQAIADDAEDQMPHKWVIDFQKVRCIIELVASRRIAEFLDELKAE